MLVVIATSQMIEIVVTHRPPCHVGLVLVCALSWFGKMIKAAGNYHS